MYVITQKKLKSRNYQQISKLSKNGSCISYFAIIGVRRTGGNHLII